MTKRSTQATLITLLTATLVLPPFGFARPPQQSGGSSPSVQEERCFLRVEIKNPKAQKDISNNEVPCNKVKWGTGGTAASATAGTPVSKKECVDERARVGKIKRQRDSKTGQSSKTCAVQQLARSTSAP